MRVAKVILPLLIVLLFVGLMTGCGSSDDVLAKVNGYEITKQEFQDYTRNRQTPYASADEEFTARREQLDSLIIRRLLVQAARQHGMEDSEELNRLVLANQDQFMLDALYKKNVTDKAEVSDAEVRDFYDHLEYKVRAAHILLDNPDTAQALLDRILAGENFGELAYEYSKDPSAKRNRGDLGYFVWGAMVPEFQQAAFNMEPGEISPPVKTDFGWHIIKVIDKAPNPQRGEYDAVKDQIRQQLLAQKRNKLAREYLDYIRDKYKISVDEVTLEYLMHKREQMYPPQILATLPRNDFDDEQLDRDERELVLATWNGGQMTLFEYLTQARRMPEQIRPEFDNYDSIASVVFTLKGQDILLQEAQEKGMEQDPEYKRKIKLFRELTMASIFKDDSLPKPPEPEEADIRRYYDKNKDEFTDPAKVHIYEIEVSDEMVANKLAREIKSLSDFKEKAMEYTIRPAKRGTNGDLDYIEERWFPKVFPAAWKTSIGDMGGPVRNKRGNYSLFWVVDKIDEALKDFLSQKARISAKLKSDRQGRAFQKWVDQKMQESDITVNEDALWTLIDRDAYPTIDTTSDTESN